MNNSLPLAIGLGNPTEWIIILVVVVVLFGGKKIPELMRGVGRGMGELQKGLDEGKRNLSEAMHHDAEKSEMDRERRLQEARSEVARLEAESGVRSDVPLPGTMAANPLPGGEPNRASSV